jgi:ubiquinone/menaquinone biosynthesis C-methylase UbiE
MPYRKTIAAAYDTGVEEEYSRLAGTPSGEAEFRLITELLAVYIPDGSTVIDIGAGPGRYSEYLLQRNCKVGVVDLSAKSLKAFSDRMEKSFCRKNILFNKVSCATQLSWIDANTADAILLMGPMYHLVNEEHRNAALTHCHRILKPGGLLFSIFLIPNVRANNDSEDIYQDKELADKRVTTKITTTSFQGYNVPQFRCRPAVAKKMMFENGIETFQTRNIVDFYTLTANGQLSYPSSYHKKFHHISSSYKSSENPDQFVCVGRALKQ